MNAASIEPPGGHPEPAWTEDDAEPGDEPDAEGAGDPVAGAPEARPAAAAPAVSEAQLAEWLDAVVDRDERALAALYDATVHRVYGLVRRIVRNDAMTEEIVEDTYFQVWRQAVRFDATRGSATAWLLSMARSRAIDAQRREARFRHDALEDDDAQASNGGSATPADELLDLARHHADLQKALLLLGAQPRQLVSLAFFRGLSHEEIAEQMRLPLGTVKSQIRRALLALRQALGGNASPASVS